MLGGLGFENAYALAMPTSRAQALGITHARRSRRPRAEPVDRRRLRILRPAGMGGGPQGLRPEVPRAAQMQPEFMYPAAAHGEVDVIAAYTSDGRIAQLDLVVLDDPKHAIPPYDAVLLISPQRANDAALLAALRPLVGAIDVDADARGQPARLGRQQRLAGEAARWLWSEIQQGNRADSALQRADHADVGRLVRRLST